MCNTGFSETVRSSRQSVKDVTHNELRLLTGRGEFFRGVMCVVLISLLGTVSCRTPRGDTIVATHFATREDAERAGIFLRGWLPGWLPPSTYDIHECHSTQTNEVWASFRFSENETGLIYQNGVETSVADIVLPREPSGQDWWIRFSRDKTGLLGGQYRLLRMKEGGFCAVDTQRLVCWYWSEGT